MRCIRNLHKYSNSYLTELLLMATLHDLAIVHFSTDLFIPKICIHRKNALQTLKAF